MAAFRHKIREYKEAAVLHKDRLPKLRDEIMTMGKALGFDEETIDVIFEIYGR